MRIVLRLLCQVRPFSFATGCALWVGALMVIAQAQAESVPVRGNVDPRIRTAAYHPDEVYRLVGVVGVSLDLEFEADEAFVGISGGDLEALTYSAHENIVTLKPRAERAEMNLAVSTTRRRYYFDYRIAPRAGREDLVYAVRFTYAARAASARGPSVEEQLERELSAAASSRSRNTDYWFCGARSLRPTAASDDGVQTRLTFGARAELPAVFVRNDDGTESLLNFSIDGGDVVVHRVANRLVLRRGALVGCVVNKHFVGGGERLPNGTVAPGVRRARTGTRS